MNDKKELRSQVKHLKQQMTESIRLKKSSQIMSLLEKNADFQKAKTILIYWSMPDEVHTHDLVDKWYKTKTILLPCVQRDVLKLKQFTGIQSLKPGELKGILEPTGPEFPGTEPIDLIVVPGVAFDIKNYRLGRGRGFYDRLLLNSHSKKIGICFDFQLFESIPIEAHDISMDEVIWA